MKVKLTKEQAKQFANGIAFKVDSTEVQKDSLLEVQKGTGDVLRRLRMENDLTEKAMAATLGIDNVDDYVAVEANQAPFAITPAGINALAKKVKKDAVELAVELLAGDASASDGSSDPGNGNGDQGNRPNPNDPPAAIKSKVGKPEKEKSFAGSGQVHVIPAEVLKKLEGAAEVSLEKAERRADLIKGLLLLDDKVDLRKDLITPEMISQGGTLTPERATALIDLVVEQDEFLRAIQVRQMAAISQEVLVWDVTSRTARTLAPGWPSTANGTEGLNRSLKLSANKMNLQFIIDDRTLVNFKANLPALESFIMQGFVKSFKSQLLDLAVNGTADGDGSAFLTIAKGWVQRIQDNAGNRATPAAQIIDVSDGAAALDTMQEIFDAVHQAGVDNNPAYFGDDVPFVVGPTDWQRHKETLATRPDAMALIVSGLEKKYQGHPVSVVPFMPTNTVIHTPLQNLVMGIVGGSGVDSISIERSRMPQATLFTVTVYCCFDVVNPNAVVLAKP